MQRSTENYATATNTGHQRRDFSVKGIMGIDTIDSSDSRYGGVQLKHERCRQKYCAVNDYCFTIQDVNNYFFGNTVNRGHKRAEYKEDLQSGLKEIDKNTSYNNGAHDICCSVCQQETAERCPMHGPLQSLRDLVKSQRSRPANKTDHATKLPYAMTSFPHEVQLCDSTVPGHVYGVSARQFIPVGTWIGPYEGVRLPANELRPNMDTSYMWEVYQDDRIICYIDGSDQNVSSWMRFIRCARHKHEQNLVAFQYCGNIYYSAFKDITPESELLVWYDDNYDQFLGIPIGLRESNVKNERHLLAQDINHAISTPTPIYPVPSRGRHPPSQATNLLGKEAIVHDESPAIESLSVFTKNTNAPDFNCDSNRSNNLSPSNDHLESGIWRCGQCFKSFTQRSLLQIHVCPRLPEKPYQCGHCAQSFAHPTDLRTHVVTHNSERPFKCGFCGRSFAGSTTLNNHIRKHTGEQPFICEKCHRPFSQASQLSRHQRLPGECQKNDVY